MTTATNLLRHEHETILRMLDATEEMARRLEHNQNVSPDKLNAAVEFFSLYAHQLHRDKEERLFFPLLADRGLHQSAGCIGLMLAEHEEGEAAFKAMWEMAVAYSNGDDEASPEWAKAARVYCAVLRNHIHREDDVLFPMAERMLTDDDVEQLHQEFAKVDDKNRRTGIADRLQELESELREFVTTLRPR
jgi:hemerythrin-like domain-containing protein